MHPRRLTKPLLLRCLSVMLLLCLCLPLQAQQRARYVFFFIGDGMGKEQRKAADLYFQAMTNNPQAKLLMNNLPVSGLSQTRSANSDVTDSAAGGTALACGCKTDNGVIGLASDRTTPLHSLAYHAHQAKMKVGILSTVPLDHATPAVFYAHQPKRNMYPEISMELIQSPYDYFAGGPMYGRIQNKTDILDLATKNGFTVTRNRQQLQDTKPGMRVIQVCGNARSFNNALPWDMDQNETDMPLAELVTHAIRLLHGDNGFFMMAEGGMIDWASHSNALTDVAREGINLNNAVQVAYDFYKQHPDETLIVITADHETGGMQPIGTPDFKPLLQQKQSYDMFKELLKTLVKEKKSFDEAQKLASAFFNLPTLAQDEIDTLQKGWDSLLSGTPIKHAAGANDPFTEACLMYQARQSGYRFTTHGHSGADVPVTAVGTGAETFAGTYDNTQVPRKIFQAMFGKAMPQ